MLRSRSSAHWWLLSPAPRKESLLLIKCLLNADTVSLPQRGSRQLLSMACCMPLAAAIADKLTIAKRSNNAQDYKEPVQPISTTAARIICVGLCGGAATAIAILMGLYSTGIQPAADCWLTCTAGGS